MNKAVFLDRDGVINFDSGYLSDPKKIQILPKVTEALRILKKLGFINIIIGNQSGVARNYFTLKTMWIIDSEIKKLLNKQETLLDDSFYCPHHPDIDKNCECRKPKIGLVKKAMKKYNLDVKKSFFIGNDSRDTLCGKNSGCKTVLIPRNLENSDLDLKVKPDFIAKNLKEVTSWIERNIQ